MEARLAGLLHWTALPGQSPAMGMTPWPCLFKSTLKTALAKEMSYVEMGYIELLYKQGRLQAARLFGATEACTAHEAACRRAKREENERAIAEMKVALGEEALPGDAGGQALALG